MTPLSGLALKPLPVYHTLFPSAQPQRPVSKDGGAQIPLSPCLEQNHPALVSKLAHEQEIRWSYWAHLLATAEPVLSWLSQAWVQGCAPTEISHVSSLKSEFNPSAFCSLQYYTLLISHYPVCLVNYWFEVKHIVLPLISFYNMPCLPSPKEKCNFTDSAPSLLLIKIREVSATRVRQMFKPTLL